jgi:hypothetical protein
MVTIRCTQKLLSRLRTAPASVVPPATTALGDWYASLFPVRRRQLVLFISERSLLPVFVEAKTSVTLIDRFREGLSEMLAAITIPSVLVQSELAELGEFAFAKTASRTVLGSMNDFVTMTKFTMKADEPLLAMALFLAKTPCTPIDGYPCDAARLLFGLPPLKSKIGHIKTLS